MSMNETPSGERIHIGFFGRRNAGKSSLVNAITNQELAVVSDTLGTTTDPVMKSMELLPLGPVVIIDTPGFDDEGELGKLRVKKTKQILNKTDIAVLVCDASIGMGECENELLEMFKKKGIPYIIANNKSDLLENEGSKSRPEGDKDYDIEIYVSSVNRENIEEFKNILATLLKDEEKRFPLVSDLVEKGDIVVLVIPIDESAPKGRLILPQQQVIRDLLEKGAYPLCTKETELSDLLKKLSPAKPDLVITDSQAFAEVSKIVGDDIPLTSFSILMARYKGYLDTALEGVHKIDELKDGDKVLIAEGCTHHRQCNDIGTVKIPRWLLEYTKKDIQIESCQGRDFPEDLSPYSLVIHCGGCMLNEREVKYRMNMSVEEGVPFTNYGTVIAYMKGILDRSTEIITMQKKVKLI
ncbi:MAG: [FeFe] hydrogenase H-cluster maturation GTPase HydF [Lachnospiraceae bacterium]|nr:[FeFe] hydrogenase H-cluster maturation GTPase HydF [Lachnospiraceae bacterium]